MINILKAKNISFKYKTDIELINNLNFELKSNEIVGLVGNSGSGKSTLGKILAGFIKDFKGEILINEKPISKQFNPIQLIYQHPEKVINPKWKMEKVIHESWEPSSDFIKKIGIKEEWFDRYSSELSGGELQRFNILRALNPSTKFIIADEISTMLDAVTQVQIWDFLLKHSKEHNIGILVISHDKYLLNRIVDYTISVDDLFIK